MYIQELQGYTTGINVQKYISYVQAQTQQVSHTKKKKKHPTLSELRKSI